MSQTVDQITLVALRLLGVKESGESLTASESADGIQALNELMEELNLQNLLQTSKTQISQALSSGDGTYTFGTGGDNSVRPIRIFNAFVRDSSGNDSTLDIISNYEYNDIELKTTNGSVPKYLYFRNAYPLSTINLFPLPGTGCTLYLECRNAATVYSLGTTSVDLSSGYIKYLKYQLAIDISPEYKEASPSVRETAGRLLALIKSNNNTDRPVMGNPIASAIHGGGGYTTLGP